MSLVMSKNPLHHPSTEMLLEFAAGTLDTAASICVAAHLHFCPKCRAELQNLSVIGAQLMAETQSEDVDDALLESVMAKIDAIPADVSPPAKESVSSAYPQCVDKLIQGAKRAPVWKRLSKSVNIARLFTGQDKYEVALHQICAGGKTPKHDHNGTEYTVVLQGCFSDEQSVYNEGDFIVRNPGDVHQPMGANNGDCICLSALEAPIKLTNPFGFFLKPFLRINPM
jgi:putative transcriptional regulator